MQGATHHTSRPTHTSTTTTSPSPSNTTTGKWYSTGTILTVAGSTEDGSIFTGPTTAQMAVSGWAARAASTCRWPSRFDSKAAATCKGNPANEREASTDARAPWQLRRARRRDGGEALAVVGS